MNSELLVLFETQMIIFHQKTHALMYCDVISFRKTWSGIYHHSVVIQKSPTLCEVNSIKTPIIDGYVIKSNASYPSYDIIRTGIHGVNQPECTLYKNAYPCESRDFKRILLNIPT